MEFRKKETLPMRYTIWTNGLFSEAATRLLEEGTQAHELIRSAHASASVLTAGQTDPALARSDIAFGQPDPADCLANPKLRWVEVMPREETISVRDLFTHSGSSWE